MNHLVVISEEAASKAVEIGFLGTFAFVISVAGGLAEPGSQATLLHASYESPICH